ncbi:hypothetical protein BU25DRAFT_161938 [Macroventuria anomochaeta]|uniref:Uncharacterized protein n=1 Tax=Macroventuria anomochaeta TaxID=301207 RepID=A0ACB6RT76_9PLEO|nr:uncharacterized protein BU25DRAFT_161938 [Macroventuria anomochaeta]KAF2624129.1 hypothetical protein BU25DRAFT_161938 [Macroventuria anomochaeta]
MPTARQRTRRHQNHITTTPKPHHDELTTCVRTTVPKTQELVLEEPPNMAARVDSTSRVHTAAHRTHSTTTITRRTRDKKTCSRYCWYFLERLLEVYSYTDPRPPCPPSCQVLAKVVDHRPPLNRSIQNDKPRHTHNVVGGEDALLFLTPLLRVGKDTVQGMCVVLCRGGQS